MSKTDTPRTDAYSRWVEKKLSTGNIVPAFFARELEAELAQARAEVAAKDALLREVVKEIDGMYERDIAGSLPLALLHLQKKLKSALEESE